VVGGEELRGLDADLAVGEVGEVLGAVVEDLGEGDGGEREVGAAQTEGDAADRDRREDGEGDATRSAAQGGKPSLMWRRARP